jgi:hypothetical protein
MTTQELEIQLLSLDQVERIRIAQLLTQSIPSQSTSSESWKNINTLSASSNTEAWNHALQQLQTPASPQSLANLLQSWEDEGDTQDQQETWEFLHQALDQDRLSDRPLFS